MNRLDLQFRLRIIQIEWKELVQIVHKGANVIYNSLPLPKTLNTGHMREHKNNPLKLR